MVLIIKRRAAPPAPAEEAIAHPVPPPPTCMDDVFEELYSRRPNAIIGWWLMASYLYYHKHCSLLSDALYDDMARRMLARWDELEHMHKHLITKADLEAGTLFALPLASYTNMIRDSADLLVANARVRWPAR